MAGLEARLGQRQRQRADPRLDPRRVALAADELGEDARVKLVLGDQHPLGERRGGVAGQHRDLDLPQKLARIDFVADQMDAGAGVAFAGGQHRFVRAQALVAGK